MPSSNVAWGVEVGAGAIKALKLVREGDRLTVADFAVINHPKVLSTPDVDKGDAIRVALGTLASQHDLSKASLAVSVPGHAAFARFAKLPPVEKKKVPDIVRFEAVQQIPFPIEEVEWDYQTFGGDPDIEVGIFAMKREQVLERLAVFGDLKLSPTSLTISPVAVYNAIAYDQAFTEATPGVVLLDVGVTATDLIVCEGGRVWIRTFPLGGHHFTEAIVEAFKVPYAKAERLKLQADQHEHKKLIFQAMKPVFGDLAQDVQRSLSYYRQLHPESNLEKILGMGSTFRLLGLRKFLSQQLQMDVVRYDKFQRLAIDGAKESDFQGASMNLVTAYGLALQGLGLATIDANLIPMSIIRESVWKKKVPWVAAAAILALLAGAVSFYRPIADRGRVDAAKADPRAQAVSDLRREGKTLMDGWKAVEEQAELGGDAERIRGLLARRDVIAHMTQDIGRMLASADPQPELFQGRAAEIPPGERRFFELRSAQIEYVTPSGGAAKGPTTLPSKSAQPTRPSDDRAGDGGGGGGGGLEFQANTRRTRNSRADRGTRSDDSESRPSRANVGALRVTLIVDSTNDTKLDFVRQTVWNWLESNKDREGVPYTFAIDNTKQFDEQVRVQPLPATTASGAAAPASAPAGGAAFGSGAGRAGAASTSGQSQPGTIDGLAPLPPQEPPVPPGTQVYRYAIEFSAPLRGPGAGRNAQEEQQ